MGQRRYGVDALRMIAMLYVVTLHILGHGGVLASAEGANYAAAWLLEGFAYCAVDCFVLITGFFMSKRQFKSERVISVWLQGVFYGLLITAAFCFIPHSDIVPFSFVHALTPVLSQTWWFLSIYVALLLVSPFLNRLIDNLSAGETFMLAGIIVVLAILGSFPTRYDPFILSGGYSLIWFMALYILGAVTGAKSIRQEGSIHTLSWGRPIIAYCAITLLGWALFIAADLRLSHDGYLYAVSRHIFSYTSPFVLTGALSLFIASLRFNVTSPRATGFIQACSPCVFGVYLLSDHPLVRQTLIQNAFAGASSMHPVTMLAIVATSAILVFAIGATIDRMRIALFNITGIGKFTRRAGETLDKVAMEMRRRLDATA